MKPIYILSFLLFGLLAVSCGNDMEMEETAMPAGMGGLNIRNVDMVDESDIPFITTKSFGMDVNTFTVEFRNEAGEVVKKFDTYKEMAEGNQPMVILPVGAYTVRAYSTEPQNGAFNAPYFMAERSFDIVEKTVTNVEKLVCKFSSVAIDLRFTDSFNLLFKDNYTITADNGAGGKVTYTKDTKGQVIYFDRTGEAMKLLVSIQPANASAPYPERTYYITNPKTGESPEIGEYYVVQFNGETPTTKVSF